MRGRVFQSVEVPLLLQFSIALFTGMVAATLVPPVRKAVPRPVEVLMWIALLGVCIAGVTSVADPSARELSTSVAWGADQIFNTIVGIAISGVGAWMFDHRLLIASWLVIVAGADVFALMLLNSMRSSQTGWPRVHLGEWMELPLPASEPTVARRHPAVDPLEGVNRRAAAMGAVVATSLMARLTEASLWLREAMRPSPAQDAEPEATSGRLDALRDATAHLGFAARSWYTAAGEPALTGLAARTARAARRKLKPAALRPGEVIDIQALLSAQSIGWYGPLDAAPAMSPGEEDGAESQRSNRLAS